ncbi:MAG: hypothetical protein R6V01_08920 [Thermoplasmatota archaeon]
MGDIYLCSRTEVLRAIYLDTGRSIGIIGAPEEFLEWIEKLLPMDSVVASEAASLKGSELDVVIGWFGDHVPESGDIEELRSGLKEDGDLWVIVPIYAADNIYDMLSMPDPSPSGELKLTLTRGHILLPLIIGHRKSRRLD